jgi:hypothetical protein
MQTSENREVIELVKQGPVGRSGSFRELTSSYIADSAVENESGKNDGCRAINARKAGR